jgi:hypothetical protein
MRRRIWVAGLVVVGAIGWYLFRPERLFVKTRVNESLPTGPVRSLLSGQFHSIAHETHGTATVHDLAAGRRVLRLTEFSTSNGPDVRVILVAANDAGDDEAVTKAATSSWGSSREPRATRTTTFPLISTWANIAR